MHLHGTPSVYDQSIPYSQGRWLEELENYIRHLIATGDYGRCVVVQDLGAFNSAAGDFSGLELHSTHRMTVTSMPGARMMKEMGCSKMITTESVSGKYSGSTSETDIEIEKELCTEPSATANGNNAL